LNKLARGKSPEIRGQAGWLVGIRMRPDEMPVIMNLLNDQDAFVRRRAAEALTRFNSPKAIPTLIARLGDSERLVRYAAMTALAHYSTADWLEAATGKSNPQIRMRALVASVIRREPPPNDNVRAVVASLLKHTLVSREDRLDFMRVLALLQKQVETDSVLRPQVADYLVKDFP